MTATRPTHASPDPAADSAPATGYILVTGSRTWTDHAAIVRALDGAWCELTEYAPGVVLVHGDAPGADRIAADLWTDWDQPCRAVPADWVRHGRAAGPRRNAQMVTAVASAARSGIPALCLAFIRDRSRGATHCAELAEQAGIRTLRFRQEGLRA